MSEVKKKFLSDIMRKYAQITVYSGNGGIICPWERELLRYYSNREIVYMWVNPVDCHAYIHIK